MTTPSDPYNPNVPQFPSDSLETSQPQFQNNFSQLYDIFLRNHVKLNDAVDAGNHTIIQLLEQEANTGIQTDLGEISVYAKDVVDQTDQVFLQYQGQGQEIQYTNYQIYKPENNDFQTKYFTFLPGKLIMYFGSISPTEQANIVDLSPYVSKHIMSISLCPIGSIPFYKPTTEILSPINGIIQGIKLSSPTFVIPLLPQFYCVVANV